MVAGNVSIVKLENQADRLMELINEASGLLETPNPASDLAGSFGKTVSNNANVIAVNMQKLWNRGKIEEVVIGGVALGAVWVGAKAIDVVSNGIAKKKAREKLLGYYNQLTSKLNMIIEKQQELIKKIEEKLVASEKDKAADAAEIEAMRNKLNQYGKIAQRIMDFKKSVEN